MSPDFDPWMDTAIWSAVLSPFIIAIMVVIRRIRHEMRHPDAPVDWNKTRLL